MPGGTIAEDRPDGMVEVEWWNVEWCAGGTWHTPSTKPEIGQEQGRTDDQETDMTGHMTRYMPGKWIKQDKELVTRKSLLGMHKETSHRG